MTDDFHAHLDACKQCAAHPFALCPVGARILADEGKAMGDEVRARYEAAHKVERSGRGAAR